jgi:hypothetical protein
MEKNTPELFNDKTVGFLVGFSAGWVRVQRYFRRRGMPHVLTIDPVIVGTKPRYVAAEVETWVESLKSKKEKLGERL